MANKKLCGTKNQTELLFAWDQHGNRENKVDLIYFMGKLNICFVLRWKKVVQIGGVYQILKYNHTFPIHAVSPCDIELTK